MSATAAQSCGAPVVDHRRQPERTLLCRVVQAHLITWLALHDGGCGGHAPALTERECSRYRECGIVDYGFARACYADCGQDFIIAYSCPTGISFGHEGRSCPSCTTRRRVETAAHLVDHVFPRLPVRQWALSLPKRVRYQFEDAELQNAVRHSLLHNAHPHTHINTRIGAVVFIHRFGGLLNAHLHFHGVMNDSVFFGEDAGHLHFQETRLTAEQMAHLQRTIRQRIVRLFVRRGLLDKAEGQAMNSCEHDGGFSLDTSVRIEAHDRQGLERLLRYCARPVFAQERLRHLDPEHLVNESKNPAWVAKSACCSPRTNGSTGSRH